MKKFIIIILDCVFFSIPLIVKARKMICYSIHYQKKRENSKAGKYYSTYLSIVYNIFRSSKEKEMKTNKHFFSPLYLRAMAKYPRKKKKKKRKISSKRRENTAIKKY